MDDFRFVGWEPVGEQSHYQVPVLDMILTGALYGETLKNRYEEQLVSAARQGRRRLPLDALPCDPHRQVRILAVIDDKDYFDQREPYDINNDFKTVGGVA